MTQLSRKIAYALAMAAGSFSLPPSIETAQRGFGFSSTIEGGRYVAHVRDRSSYMPHQGQRECARRQRQMGLV